MIWLENATKFPKVMDGNLLDDVIKKTPLKQQSKEAPKLTKILNDVWVLWPNQTAKQWQVILATNS